MKLRNKKTGQLGNFIINKDHFECVDLDYVPEYRNLTELNAEWEDYEDELFYIVSAEHKDGYICALKEDYKELCDIAKKLGIGFETEKEAKKAVEKLKAWKRLKDKGFRFKTWVYALEGNRENGSIPLEIKVESKVDIFCKDLDLLFGGEE